MLKTCKKLFAVMLAMAMMVSLAACGNKKAAETDVKATPTLGADTAQATQAPEATPTSIPEQYEAFDFGGRTIKVGVWWDYYYTSDHKDISEDPKLDNAETAQMKLDNVRRIEEKYNCKIQYVNLTWNGVINSINTSIAAGTPECDIYMTDLQFGIPAALNGLCMDLKSVALENNDLFGKQTVVKPLETEAFDGTYFFKPAELPISGIFLGYNATMIKDLGLEDPQELYEKGEWTWDKFAEMAKAGNQDTDNDGTTDIYGYGGIFTDMVNGLVMNNGGQIAAGATQTLDSAPVVEALEFMNRLYNKDNSARTWNVDSWDDNLLAWSDGKVMFWNAQAWSLRQEIDDAIKAGAELPFEYHVVPYPTGPSGDGTPYSPASGSYYMIPVGTQEPGKVLQIFEEYLNWYAGDTELRDDPTWFESCFQSDKDVELAFECGRNLKFDMWGSLTPYYDFGATVFFPIAVDKTQTVAQAVESAKPSLQNALDILYSAD
jgi:multiple sugar transport system substrate-binding protein